MANLPLAFAEILAGAVVLDAAVKGASISDVVKGQAAITPLDGSTATGSGSASASGSPLPGVTKWERTDQGVDASAAPGSPVNALVGGTVSAIVPNWYSGQPAVYVDSPGLPGGATGIYYAEQLLPHVKVGDRVSAGQQLGTVAGSGTGLEIGFAKGTQTLAQATTGYVEGQVTKAGQLMHDFLASAGAFK